MPAGRSLEAIYPRPGPAGRPQVAGRTAATGRHGVDGASGRESPHAAAATRGPRRWAAEPAKYARASGSAACLRATQPGPEPRATAPRRGSRRRMGYPSQYRDRFHSTAGTPPRAPPGAPDRMAQARRTRLRAGDPGPRMQGSGTPQTPACAGFPSAGTPARRSTMACPRLRGVSGSRPRRRCAVPEHAARARGTASGDALRDGRRGAPPAGGICPRSRAVPGADADPRAAEAAARRGPRAARGARAAAVRGRDRNGPSA